MSEIKAQRKADAAQAKDRVEKQATRIDRVTAVDAARVEEHLRVARLAKAPVETRHRSLGRVEQ